MDGVGVGGISRGSSGGQNTGDKDPAVGLGGWTALFQGVCVAETRARVEKRQEMRGWEALMATEGVRVQSPGGRVIKLGITDSGLCSGIVTPSPQYLEGCGWSLSPECLDIRTWAWLWGLVVGG